MISKVDLSIHLDDFKFYSFYSRQMKNVQRKCFLHERSIYSVMESVYVVHLSHYILLFQNLYYDMRKT